MFCYPEIGDRVVIRSKNKIQGEILAIHQTSVLLQLTDEKVGPVGRTTIERVSNGWKLSDEKVIPSESILLIKSQKIAFEEALSLDNAKVIFSGGGVRYYTRVYNLYFPTEGGQPIELIRSGSQFKIAHSNILVDAVFSKSFNRFDSSEDQLNQIDYGYLFHPSNKESITEIIEERFYYLLASSLFYRGVSKFEIEKVECDLGPVADRFYLKIITEIERTGCLPELQDIDYLAELG